MEHLRHSSLIITTKNDSVFLKISATSEKTLLCLGFVGQVQIGLLGEVGRWEWIRTIDRRIIDPLLYRAELPTYKPKHIVYVLGRALNELSALVLSEIVKIYS